MLLVKGSQSEQKWRPKAAFFASFCNYTAKFSGRIIALLMKIQGSFLFAELIGLSDTSDIVLFCCRVDTVLPDMAINRLSGYFATARRPLTLD